MKYKVHVTYNTDNYSSNQYYRNWADCRTFLLTLADKNDILIRDIADSLLQVGAYIHHNKWYTLKVTCKNDVTIGEAIEAIENYSCNFHNGCNECPLHMKFDDVSVCLSIEARDIANKLRRNEK